MYKLIFKLIVRNEEMNVKDLIVSEDILIDDLLQKMNDTGQGMLLVGSEENVIAIITDGDIRRYILAHGKVDVNIKKIANYSPKMMSVVNATENNVRKYMLEHRIQVLPIIDSYGKVQRIEFKSGQKIYRKKNEKDLKIVIMAGGKGTRLAPFTNILPKPLIPVGEKTIIEHIIEQFNNWGYRKFDIIINYRKEVIKAFFSENVFHNINNVDINLWEEKECLGTAGGLKLLQEELQSTFILSNCDILVNADYSELLRSHKESQNLITVIVAPKKVKIPYGTFDIAENGCIKSMKEKPIYECLINTGVYVVEPEIIDMIKDNTYVHFTDIMQCCLDQGLKIGTYEVLEDGWMDMGEFSALKNMEKKMGYN